MTDSTREFIPVAPLLGDTRLSNTERWSKIIAPVLLSKSEFFKLLAMVLIVSPFFGLTGIFFLLCMHVLSILRVGSDSAEKHGISTRPSSRLGGLAIAIMMFAYIGFTFISSTEPMILNNTERLGGVAVLLMAVLGLSEDLKADYLSPLVRLAAQLVFMGGILFAADAYIPDSLGLPVIDYLLTIPLVGWVLCTIFAVGFVNAMNMADGANGLIPGITFAAFFVFASETGRMFEVGYMSACAIFLVFNVISGRFFLGDMGSYGLGAAVALYGLWFVSEGAISASFLACLLAYPCLDLLMSIFRRVLDGRSPFSPDNEHLHNRLFRQVRGRIDNPVVANSLTGLLVSGSTSGITVLGYLQAWWPISDNSWLVLFAAEAVLYFAVYWATGLTRKLG
jgi:UDP-N-acetylmuramyl pentapeptide phosphotransferase/UDP-N-acetylglucosamine-1-phosphate transferase